MTISIPSQDEPLIISQNDPRDFAKPVKAITLPQDVPSTSNRRLIELENQVQRLLEAHLAPTQPTHVKKTLPHVRSIVVPTTLSIAWKTPEQAFVEYASSRIDEAGGTFQGCNHFPNKPAATKKSETEPQQQEKSRTPTFEDDSRDLLLPTQF
ncbi:hypothetical protein Tco_0570464 [Tanacetum coccineum]